MSSNTYVCVKLHLTKCLPACMVYLQRLIYQGVDKILF